MTNNSTTDDYALIVSFDQYALIVYWRQSEHNNRNVTLSTIGSFQNQNFSQEIYTRCSHKPRLVDKSLNVYRGDSVPTLSRDSLGILARLLAREHGWPRETTALTTTVPFNRVEVGQPVVRARAVIWREQRHNSTISPRWTINDLSTNLPQPSPNKTLT